MKTRDLHVNDLDLKWTAEAVWSGLDLTWTSSTFTPHSTLSGNSIASTRAVAPDFSMSSCYDDIQSPYQDGPH